jgi:multidrug efflux pump subunit AcrA (membrane-fusion protein)
MKIRTFLIAAGIIACSFGSCSDKESKNGEQTTQSGSTEIESITGIARIEPENGLLTIYANSNGRITKIVALENQNIAGESPLLILDNAVEKALLDVEKSKIAAQNAAIESAIQTAESVKNDLDKAVSDLALKEQLFAVKGTTEQVLADSRVKVEKLTIDYAKAIADKNQQADKFGEIKANINYRKVLLDERTLNSSFAGHVLQWEVHNGDYVMQGQKLGQFAPEGSLVAVTEIDELFQDRIKAGMTAEVYSQLNGERIGTGTVVYIADFLKKKSLFSDENAVEDRRVKEVKVKLTSDSKAVINSKVDCSINLK